MPGLASSASRAAIQFRLPRIVLISPLWAMYRYGCASGQDGNVLVENRLCTSAMADATRSSARSGKKLGNWSGVSMPFHVMVRLDSDGKCSSIARSRVSRSVWRRTAYIARSSSIPDSGSPAGSVNRSAARKTCAMRGMADRALAPRSDGSTGTSRQARTRAPSTNAYFSSTRRAAAARSASAGRNARPVAYWPAAGSDTPATARQNASGTCIRIPAPSPVFGSAPRAPRWSIRRSAASPRHTTSWDRRPATSATNATPHESCSYAGSYRPCGCCGFRGGVEVIGPPIVVVEAWRDDVGPGGRVVSVRESGSKPRSVNGSRGRGEAHPGLVAARVRLPGSVPERRFRAPGVTRRPEDP